MVLSGAPAKSGPDEEPRWRVVLVFALMVAALYVVAGPRVRLSEWRVRSDTGGTSCHSLLEARSWHDGRLDIDATGPHPELGHDRPRDTAYRDGKVYNVFPPLFTFISYVVLALQEAQGLVGEEARSFYPPWYVCLTVLPLPLLGFWVFRNVTGRSEWAAVMTAYWILGTPLFKMLVNCRTAEVNELNHVLSNVGLMLIAGDLIGKRRIWPAAIGLLIGIWTRQLTVLYAVGAVWIVWRLTRHRWRGLATVGAAVAIGVGALAALNWAKFGSPLDSGYASIYVGRDDLYAQRARDPGVFSVEHVPRNFYYMNLSPPGIRLAPMMLQLGGHGDGSSIWISSPLLLFGLFTVRRWWRDPARRALMLSSFLVILAFLCYHNTGSVQHGLYRFALDFVPVWLVVIAPYLLETARRRWATIACLGYSALYFHVLCGPGGVCGDSRKSKLRNGERSEFVWWAIGGCPVKRDISGEQVDGR